MINLSFLFIELVLLLRICSSFRNLNFQITTISILKQQLVSLKLSNNDDSKNFNSNHRFWTRTLFHSDNSTIQFDGLCDTLKDIFCENDIDISKLEAGIVSIDSLDLMVPIHDGMLQSQHIVPRSDDSFGNSKSRTKPNIRLYGFSRRAKHVTISPNEEERPVDDARLKSLAISLQYFSNTTIDELLSEQLAGTPPARIMRSFVQPRQQREYLLEPIERAANRTAAQIEMAMRQIRADQASYLRNNDKSIISKVQSQLHPVVLVLDNIRSAFNVGSMFRTGETAGITELITCGITAHPPFNTKLRKTAFTSIDVVPTQHFDDSMQAIQYLKENGYTICALETTSKSKIFYEVSYPHKVALVLGNEVTGVDTRIMDVADMIVEIPSYGIKNSLNVASACPVVLFEVLRQFHVSNKIN